MNGLGNDPPLRLLPASIVGKPNTSNRTGGPAMVLPALVPNATDAMAAAELLRRPGFVQTYTHKARDPVVKEQITAGTVVKTNVSPCTESVGASRN